jgi:hypothetical protein
VVNAVHNLQVCSRAADDADVALQELQACELRQSLRQLEALISELDGRDRHLDVIRSILEHCQLMADSLGSRRLVEDYGSEDDDGSQTQQDDVRDDTSEPLDCVTDWGAPETESSCKSKPSRWDRCHTHSLSPEYVAVPVQHSRWDDTSPYKEAPRVEYRQGSVSATPSAPVIPDIDRELVESMWLFTGLSIDSSQQDFASIKKFTDECIACKKRATELAEGCDESQECHKEHWSWL